jgi:hypothetical protein
VLPEFWGHDWPISIHHALGAIFLPVVSWLYSASPVLARGRVAATRALFIHLKHHHTHPQARKCRDGATRLCIISPPPAASLVPHAARFRGSQLSSATGQSLAFHHAFTPGQGCCSIGKRIMYTLHRSSPSPTLRTSMSLRPSVFLPFLSFIHDRQINAKASEA